ncbi:MAG: thiol:disulfide interchange protein DsbA/DsbL [Agarilytica sp.]
MRILTFVFALIAAVSACAQEPNSVELYQKGVHYKILPAAVPTVTPGKIEVTEAFAYSCGHCERFEPLVLNWKKGMADDVAFVKLPVIWRKPMESLARIMYTGEALGISDQVNARVFKAMHKEKKQLANEAEIAAIFKELGVDAEKFKKTYKSFGVSSKVQQADARTRSMKITGTPQLIVDGRYSVSATKELGHAGMLKVVDFLIEKVRSER